MLTTARKVKRVDTQQKVVDTLTAKIDVHKAGLTEAQQLLKLALAELAYRKSAPTFDPEPVDKDAVDKAGEVVKAPATLDGGTTVQVALPDDEPSF